MYKNTHLHTTHTHTDKNTSNALLSSSLDNHETLRSRWQWKYFRANFTGLNHSCFKDGNAYILIHLFRKESTLKQSEFCNKAKWVHHLSKKKLVKVNK